MWPATAYLMFLAGPCAVACRPAGAPFAVMLCALCLLVADCSLLARLRVLCRNRLGHAPAILAQAASFMPAALWSVDM